MSKNERAQNLAYDWLKWLHTRSFYGQPPPKHILAMLSMPDTGGEPPDAKNNPEMPAFHASVVSLPEHLGRAFLKVYCGFPDAPVKTLAFNEGIDRSVYYDRAHEAAAQVMRGVSLIGIHSLLKP